VVVKKVDQVGFDFITKHEGLRLEAYLCPAKVWTIGYGQTFYPGGKRVQNGDLITIEEANDMFKKVLANFEQNVYNLTRDDISQNQFNALASFAYNIGIGALRGSTLLKKVNKDPNDPAIKDEFMKWVNGGGGILAGLVKRRREEAKLYFTV
jgi:lysozyme